MCFFLSGQILIFCIFVGKNWFHEFFADFRALYSIMFFSTFYLPHGCGLLTMSRSNSTLVICSWIDSWFASANKYNKVHEKYWVWLFGYLSWLAIQFKNKYLPSVSKSTAKFWNISICEEWAKRKKKAKYF